MEDSQVKIKIGIQRDANALLIPLSDKTALPVSFTARVDDTSVPYILILKVTDTDSLPTLSSLKIEMRPDLMITQADLRKIDIPKLLEMCCHSAVVNLAPLYPELIESITFDGQMMSINVMADFGR